MRQNWLCPVVGVILLMWLAVFAVLPAQGSQALHDAVVKQGTQIEPAFHRIVEKDNLSNTDFDWRFNLKKIDAWKGHTIIGLREEQNSGMSPNSNFVIKYSFIDYDSDGTLDEWYVQRFISVEVGENDWRVINPSWPDKFNYPQDKLTREQAEAKWKEELNFWMYRLKAEE